MGVLHAAKRAFRRAMHRHHRMKRGYIYHHHCWEIVVSKKELMIQLEECSQQDHLLRLLVFGKEQPDYERLLLLVSLKFEFLGCLVHPVSKTKTEKPPLKAYISRLFEGFYETPAEVKAHIEQLTGSSISEDDAQKVFRKRLFVVYTCCPCMADSCEIWWSETYRCFLEYAVEQDTFHYPACEAANSIWNAMPKGLPRYGNKRSFVLNHVPPDLRMRVINEDSSYTIRW